MRKHITLVLIALILAVSPTPSAADDVIRISTSYNSMLSNPEQTGMLDRILKEAFRRIGREAQIVFTPNERSLVEVNEGKLDAELNRVAGMEKNYPNLIRVPEPNMQMHFVAFSKKDFSISGWNSLARLKVGLVCGWKILENSTKGVCNVTRVLKEDQLFQMLDRGRLDIALYSKLNGYELIKKYGYKNIRHLEPPLVSKDMFLYMNEKHAALVPHLAAALREMKQDCTYDRIVAETIHH